MTWLLTMGSVRPFHLGRSPRPLCAACLLLVSARRCAHTHTHTCALTHTHTHIRNNGLMHVQKSDNECLKAMDLQRAISLGKGIVPSGPNAKLVGSRWKYIPRPAEGDVVYTDYYGA